MKNFKHIGAHALTTFISEIITAVKEGWEVDEWNPPMQVGMLYECRMARDADIVDPPAAPTRAEILTKARAAKKARAEVAEDTGSPE